jgi:hypothetical protein
MYYPEANVLIGRDVDALSRTPAFKNIVVRVERPDSTQLREIATNDE